MKTGGVDTLDGLIAKYTCRRKTKRWTLNAFMYLLDVAAYNTHVIFKLKNNDEFKRNRCGKRKEYLEKLAVDLMILQIEKRAECLTENYLHVIKGYFYEALIKCGF